MGGPAGVPDPDPAGTDTSLQALFEDPDLALRPGNREFSVVKHGDSRGVIPPVFKSPQALQEHFLDITVSDVAYDAAHC
jgi:hypothetical protein